MRAAIVDDDVCEAQLIAELLCATARDSCQVFASGAAFIEGRVHERFDLVVLDWNIADMPAAAVLRWIRTNCSASLPVLCITGTGRGTEDDIAIALETGADSCMARPCSPAVLRARAASLLRRAANWRGGVVR